MTGGFWWENYKSSFDEAERERERESRGSCLWPAPPSRAGEVDSRTIDWG